MGESLKAMYAAVPVLSLWDDHELSNNWSPSMVYDARYTEKSVALLAARGLETRRLTTHHATLEDVFLAMTGRSLESTS